MKRTIPLEEAFALLMDADAVKISGTMLTGTPDLSPLNGEVDNEFLHLSWVDDGDGCFIVATEGENREVEVDEFGNLVLIDNEGDSITLTLLVVKKV